MNFDWIVPAERIQKLPPYVFARLDELKAKAREQGLDLIDLGMMTPTTLFFLEEASRCWGTSLNSTK